MNPNVFHLSEHNKIRSAVECLAGPHWKNVLTCNNHALDPNRKWLETTGILISTPALPGTMTGLLCQFISKGRCNDRKWVAVQFICIYGNGARHLPAKSCHTMHGDAAARFLSELGVEQLEPIVNNLSGRRAAIIERPVLRDDTIMKRLVSKNPSKDVTKLTELSTLTRTWIPSFSTGALS